VTGTWVIAEKEWNYTYKTTTWRIWGWSLTRVLDSMRARVLCALPRGPYVLYCHWPTLEMTHNGAAQGTAQESVCLENMWSLLSLIRGCNLPSPSCQVSSAK